MQDPQITKIRAYIRGMDTDYEQGLDIPGLSLFKAGDIFGKKIEGVNSYYANSLIGEPTEDQYGEAVDNIFNFYKDRSFSWMINAGEEYSYLIRLLEERGMVPFETYYGMYFVVDKNKSDEKKRQTTVIKDVQSLEEIEKLVDLSCEIFHIDAQNNKQAMIEERKKILQNPLNRSGLCLSYLEEKPVGYSRYRFSSDGNAMYLNGSGVLENYRKMGIYHSLLDYRIKKAREKDCSVLVVYAQDNTSKPILEKVGFRIAGKYSLMVREVKV